jgi:DNA-binding transcriptional regulator YhcF (GntR family)
MHLIAAPSLGERLYLVIRADVAAGQLPPGARLPAKERVAAELAIEPVDVQAAYSRLLTEGVLEERADGTLGIPGHGQENDIGDATQIRFEAALFRAVREAAARGLSGRETTGVFEAAVVRWEEIQRKRRVE